MKHLLSLAVIGIFSLSANAIEIPYNYLKKSYENEYDKTLERAERCMKLLPNNPAAYYYASLVHFENAQKQTVVRKRYLGLVKSLRYARELESKQDTEFLELISWDTLTPYIQDFTVNVNKELNEAELYKLSAIVERRAKHLDWMGPSVKSEDVAANESNAFKTESKISSGMFNGQYFGMPSGTELIKSHDNLSEREMLDLINKERLSQGMQLFSWDEDLARAARYHAFDMGTQDYFDHKSYDRSNGKLTTAGGTFTRIGAFYTASFANSENIAAGNQAAEHTYKQWYHSQGHYDNMFNESSAKIGIGVVYVPGSEYGYYWVMCTAL
jgi:uncharacterized protein YkwD